MQALSQPVGLLTQLHHSFNWFQMSWCVIQRFLTLSDRKYSLYGSRTHQLKPVKTVMQSIFKIRRFKKNEFLYYTITCMYCTCMCNCASPFYCNFLWYQLFNLFVTVIMTKKRPWASLLPLLTKPLPLPPLQRAPNPPNWLTLEQPQI